MPAVQSHRVAFVERHAGTGLPENFSARTFHYLDSNPGYIDTSQLRSGSELQDLVYLYCTGLKMRTNYL